jgi:hypothetical protein
MGARSVRRAVAVARHEQGITPCGTKLRRRAVVVDGANLQRVLLADGAIRRPQPRLGEVQDVTWWGDGGRRIASGWHDGSFTLIAGDLIGSPAAALREGTAWMAQSRASASGAQLAW